MANPLILVLEKVSTACCGAPAVSGCLPRYELRCGLCGHRVARGSVQPRATRRMPPWTWPGELAGRRQAVKALATSPPGSGGRGEP